MQKKKLSKQNTQKKSQMHGFSEQNNPQKVK